MNYNQRRMGPYGPQSSAVGMRRPMHGNFVSGGQLNPGIRAPYPTLNQNPNQFKPQHHQQIYNQPLRKPQPQQQLQKQQQKQLPPPQQQQQPLPPPPQQQLKLQQQQQQQQVNQEQPPPVKQELNTSLNQSLNQNDAVVSGGQPGMETEMAVDAVDSDAVEKKKPFWIKNQGKISKKEKLYRRNKRLVKMLQPKNAVMVLNEMISGTVFNVQEQNDKGVFRASVVVDGVEHFGLGRSKVAAKGAAAETAIKYLVLKKLKNPPQGMVVANGEEALKADVEEAEGEDDAMLPWQQVASFALHKLFSTWDESGDMTERLVMGSATLATIEGRERAVPLENKPAKKMPPNPEKMNPVMLLNQMVPHAVFEELSKAGNPPNVIYTYKCVISGRSFIGRGGSKKMAKKMCAYEACRDVLHVDYPMDVFTGSVGQTNVGEPMS